ncbi:MAG: nucleotidyltransferase domain-containing protein [Gaiellaceae bacterium]
MALRHGTSVWLYGSFARGDADELSDIDILVAGGDGEWRDAVSQDPQLAWLELSGHAFSPMQFSWGELEAMCAYGSLFLHHVKLEGRAVTPEENDPLEQLLAGLPRYRRATDEMQAFTVVLQDVAKSLRGDHSPNFEMAVVATALRHAFILGCYVTGQPDFGRASPFETLSATLRLSPETVDELQTLYGFRLHQQGRSDLPFDATTQDVVTSTERAATLFQDIQRRVDAFDRAMP